MSSSMTTYEPLSLPRAVVIGRASPRHGRYRRLRARMAAWLRTCIGYYDAATLYEQLNRLSDAELARRGLQRGNLSRDVSVACDRTIAPSRE